MGACTSVTRDKDPITASTANVNSTGVSKVTPFSVYKESKSSSNFGDLNNSITLNRQQSFKKKKSVINDESANDDKEDIGYLKTEINEFR